MLTTYYPYAAPTNAISDSYEGVPKVYAGFLSNEAATKPMRNEARCVRHKGRIASWLVGK